MLCCAVALSALSNHQSHLPLQIRPTSILVGDVRPCVKSVLLAQPVLELRGDAAAVALPHQVALRHVAHQTARVELAPGECGGMCGEGEHSKITRIDASICRNLHDTNNLLQARVHAVSGKYQTKTIHVNKRTCNAHRMIMLSLKVLDK